MTTTLPGKELAQELEAQSLSQVLDTPMESVIEAAAAGTLGEDQYFRLVGQLWAMERMYYYVYGAWGTSLVVNQYPPSVDYLFAKQVYDDSTHEMLYGHAILQKGWAKFQRSALRHPYCRFVAASGIGVYIFSLRGMGIYAQNLRIPALNLGPKVLELSWLERLGEAISDPYLSNLFTSQIPETRSHVQMGRFMVERFVTQGVDAEMCRSMVPTTSRDYNAALASIADLVLTQGEAAASPPADAEMPDVE